MGNKSIMRLINVGAEGKADNNAKAKKHAKYVLRKDATTKSLTYFEMVPSENPIDYLPVKNLITLSLDENGKYRGAAHRQDDVQHHEISADFASNGFFKGKIEEGVWRIALNVHCCACKVSYNLKITGEAEK